MKRLLIVASLLVLSCSDEIENQQQTDAHRGISSQDSSTSLEPDLYVIGFTPPDAYVDPCEGSTSRAANFCDCKPQCCQVQRWYCPPSGLGVNALDVIMNICDESFEPCDRSTDFNCPPAEILSQGDCRSVLDCPPSIDNDITITVRCEIEGVEGTQRIICSKGNIEYQECITCTPSEERCNFADDDCDGAIDEDQRNVCDQCGPVPSEECNDIDDDCDGSTDEDLVQECSTPCERGLETCQDGNWISCTAARPTEEACDGADNDCDGQVDEQLNCLCDISDVGSLQPCNEAPLLCGQGFKMCDCVDPECTELRMTDCLAFCNYFPTPDQDCDPLLGMALATEECNAFDEDCDELIDEELSQACYTGPPDTLGAGVCTPGQVYCTLGSWGSDHNGAFVPGLCDGEVTPSDEICDGADNDCDGEVDYGEEIRNTDILFIVDWSGSMDDSIAAVRVALSQFAQQFAAEEALQWGLIIGPKEIGPAHSNREWLIKVSDISPFDNFLQDFASLGSEGMNTGSEMLLDALYFAIQNITAAAPYDVPSAEWSQNIGSVPEKENFTISWRPESEKVVIVFSDEEVQSFLNPGITDMIILPALRGSVNLKLYAFVDPGLAGDTWEDLVLATAGRRFRLTSDANQMYNNLVSIIDEACLPRQQQASAASLMYQMVSLPGARYDYETGICF